MIKCPYCDFKGKNFMGLAFHIRKAHFAGNVCPECGKRYRNLMKHIRMQAEFGDEGHTILYGILARLTNNRREHKEFVAECRDMAEAVLGVVQC